MMGIRSVIYEKNNKYFIIDLDNECKLSYSGVFVTLDNEIALEYLRILFSIIVNWEKEYVNQTINNIQNWKLSIISTNGERNEYCGYSSFPPNFSEFEKLNNILINKVM